MLPPKLNKVPLLGDGSQKCTPASTLPNMLFNAWRRADRSLLSINGTWTTYHLAVPKWHLVAFMQKHWVYVVILGEIWNGSLYVWNVPWHCSYSTDEACPLQVIASAWDGGVSSFGPSSTRTTTPYWLTTATLTLPKTSTGILTVVRVGTFTWSPACEDSSPWKLVYSKDANPMNQDVSVTLITHIKELSSQRKPE